MAAADSSLSRLGHSLRALLTFLTLALPHVCVPHTPFIVLTAQHKTAYQAEVVAFILCPTWSLCSLPSVQRWSAKAGMAHEWSCVQQQLGGALQDPI
jgi:hypothetical protein